MTTETTTKPWPVPSAWTLEPPAMLAELRRREPISRVTLWDGRQAWLVTRYTDARRLLRDPRLSSDSTDPDFPSLTPRRITVGDKPPMVRAGEPRHTVLRQALARQFTRRAIERWRPAIQRIAREQAAGLLADGPPADLVSRYALPIPVRVIGAMFGVRGDELAALKEYGPRVNARVAEAAGSAPDDFRTYVDDLVRRAESTPGNDLMGVLVHKHRAGAISHDDAVDLVSNLLLAGHGTTGSMIGFGALSLLGNPALFRAIGEDPAAVGPVVEEVLRCHTIDTDGAPRLATADLTVAGVQIRAGDAVIISVAAANRDEQVFDHPDVIDPARTGPSHMGFGYGQRRCPGEHLARLEMRIAFTTLARAVPALRLAVPMEQLRFWPNIKQHCLRELPVTW